MSLDASCSRLGCHLGVDALDSEKDSTCPDSGCLYFGSAQNSLRRFNLLSSSFSGSWGIFSNSSGSSFDEERVLARNGTRVLSSLSHLVAVLEKSGIDGPRHLQAINLDTCGEVIGYGSQFTVFRDSPTSTGIMGTGYDRLGGLVAKRVKIAAIQDNSQDLISGDNYRRNLMSLELEILALCHPRIRLHRNVVDIVAWGYDYPTLQTPIPVLFMEEASSTLAQFLKNERKWEIKQHLALDIAAGLEVLHQHNIVHGDMKPANVLIFEQTHTNIPFVAKLSDFGVCIDLLNSPSLLTVYDYIGTPDWKAPELSRPHELETSVPGGFRPRMMLHFDAYSYGLVVVSIFCKNGEVPQLGVTRHSNNSHGQSAADLIRDREELPPVLKSKLSLALKSLLTSEPLSRALPNPKSLMTDCPSCRDWVLAHEIPTKSVRKEGHKDPRYNVGPAFWTKLDKHLIEQLELQHSKPANDKELSFAPETLFGLAQGLSSHPLAAYIDKVLCYVEEAATAQFLPAQAVYHQMLRAHKETLPDGSKIKEYSMRAIATGYLFPSQNDLLTREQIEDAKMHFRKNGGFCTDDFLRRPEVVEIARDPNLLKDWTKKNSLTIKIDLEGNCMAHAVAVLGSCESLLYILEDSGSHLHEQNDNGETPLYKACQSGRAEIVRMLIKSGAAISISTKREKVTPLHWLFVFSDDDIDGICSLLINTANANIDATIMPEAIDSSVYHPKPIHMQHYPFEFPYGTALHWASFARNRCATTALLKHNAFVDATYFEGGSGSTPLALAVQLGEAGMVRLLLENGADARATDPKGRTLFHLMSDMSDVLSTYHGAMPRQWHYWIRHETWENHLQQTSEIVNLLKISGANLEAQTSIIPGLTPAMRAATVGTNNGGVLAALVEAGADITETRGVCGDSALHSWSQTLSECLDYPKSYPYVMDLILQKMVNVSLRNDIQESPLHIVAGTESSNDQFIQNVKALLSTILPADINAFDRDGRTPLYHALLARRNPIARAELFLSFGASIVFVSTRNDNIFAAITYNECISDEESAVYIKTLVDRISQEDLTLLKSSSRKALQNSCQYGRPRTLSLFLGLGLDVYINDVQKRRTFLDWALDSAEECRQDYMEEFSKHFACPDADPRTLSASLYNLRNNGSLRAEEAYWAFPTVIRILLDYGAQRACQIDDHEDPEEIQQARLFDLNNIYSTVFTPSTQPHRDHWSFLYGFAKYPETWMQNQVDEALDYYENGTFVPELKALKAWPELCEALGNRKGEWVKVIENSRIREARVVEDRIVGTTRHAIDANNLGQADNAGFSGGEY